MTHSQCELVMSAYTSIHCFVVIVYVVHVNCFKQYFLIQDAELLNSIKSVNYTYLQCISCIMSLGVFFKVALKGYFTTFKSGWAFILTFIIQ